MKKSKLLILISLLALGCNTGSLSSENSKDGFSNSNTFIQSSEQFNMNYISSHFHYVYCNLCAYDDNNAYLLLDNALAYSELNFENVILEYRQPSFIVEGDYLNISYFGEIDYLVNTDEINCTGPNFNYYKCILIGEIISVEYVKAEIVSATYSDLLNYGLKYVIEDTEYSILDIQEANNDISYYVSKGFNGMVKAAYTFNPLEI